MLLEVRNLELQYGNALALKGVSLTVNAGEIVALLGSNGAGKTSLLKAISGVEELTSGEVWFEGKRIDKTPAHERVKLGISHIPQGRRLFPDLLVKQNLELGAYTCRNRKQVAAKFKQVYAIFPVLKEKRDKAARTLSGGEQQMLATSRGFVSSPKLLMMDEPSLGLSPLLVKELARVIKTISQEQIGILLVEQNAMMALRLASRAYIIELGNVVVEGKSSDLITDARIRKAYLGI
jgi:branched-chain amino acid transport system ATP-binding protein